MTGSITTVLQVSAKMEQIIWSQEREMLLPQSIHNSLSDECSEQSSNDQPDDNPWMYAGTIN